MHDLSTSSEHASVGVTLSNHEPIVWRAVWSVHKYADPTGAVADTLKSGAALDAFTPDDVIEREG